MQVKLKSTMNAGMLKDKDYEKKLDSLRNLTVTLMIMLKKNYKETK